jgi:iron complex outermembrane recepter protein
MNSASKARSSDGVSRPLNGLSNSTRDVGRLAVILMAMLVLLGRLAPNRAGELIALTLPAVATTPVSEVAADRSTATLSTSSGQILDATVGTSEELGEVIVTATRREEALSKVPISVETLTATQMQLAGVREMADVVRFTPGLVLNQLDDGGNNIAIRGIASSAGASTTGVYIDDTPIQLRQLQYAAGTVFPVVFDLERVEVLRGPQGTLFGAGSEGGTIRFIQEQPSMSEYTWHARAEGAGIQDHAASYEVGASFGGPVVQDTIGFRVSAYYRRDGGYLDYGPVSSFTVHHFDGEGLSGAATMDPEAGALHEDVNWQDTKAFHAALEFAPTPGLTVTPSFLYKGPDQGIANNTNYMAGSKTGGGF